MAEGKAELTEISASEILDKIEKGEPVEYDHVRITDDLDVNKLDNLPSKHVDRTEDLKKIHGISEECKVVSPSIKITNSTFNGKVNFSNIIFLEDSINFGNTTFSMDADFVGVTFNGNVFFMGATFSMNAFFMGVIFRSAFFIWATFRYPDFSRATFDGEADFMKVTFNGNAFFMVATFSGDANFSEATFRRKALFSGAKFAGEVLTFKKAVFGNPESQEDACRRAKICLQRRAIEMKRSTTSIERWKQNGYRKESEETADLV